MSELSKQALRVENNQSFPNNNAGLITPTALRNFNGDMIDSTVNQTIYTADSASFDSRIDQAVVTASISGDTITFEKDNGSTFDITIAGATLPPGVVSGSSQIILTQTTGNLGGNRITGSVASATLATNATYVNVQPNAINSNYYPSFTNGTGLNTTVYIDTTGYTYNPGQNRLTISNVSATSVTASVSVTSPTFYGDLDGNALTATNATYSQNTITTGKNLHNTTIAKGTPLYFTGSGTSGNLVGVYPADAGNPARMPAGGVAGESIAVGAEGVVLLDGYIGNVDTSLFASGDEVFVAVGGGYTNVAPTGSALIQHLGNVEKSAVNGSGVIQMMGEVRGLPNLQQGYAWVGDVNSVPQAVSTGSWGGGGTINTGSFATTGSNTFTGNQTIQVGTEKTVLSNTQVYFQNNFDPIETRMTKNGLLLNDNSGQSALVVSAAPYNLFSLGISDYNGPLRGIFYNTGSNTSTETLPVLGVKQGNQFDNKAYLMLDTFVSGTFTASLQEGYVWAGGAGNSTITVPTSSFGGGGSAFPYTGDAQITGSLGVSNTVTSQIFINPQTLTGTQTVPTGYNGMLTGPVSNAGTIVVESGSTLVII